MEHVIVFLAQMAAILLLLLIIAVMAGVVIGVTKGILRAIAVNRAAASDPHEDRQRSA